MLGTRGASLDSPAGPAGDPANGPAEVSLLARTSSTWARVKRTPAGAALLIPEVRGCVIHKIHGTNPNGTDRKPRWQGRCRMPDGKKRSFTSTIVEDTEDANVEAYTAVVDLLWRWHEEVVYKLIEPWGRRVQVSSRACFLPGI